MIPSPCAAHPDARRAAALLVVLCSFSACVSRARISNVVAKDGFARAVEQTLLAEQSDASDVAFRTHLDLLDAAVDAPDAPYAMHAMNIALWQLIRRDVLGLDGVVPRSALVYRVADGPQVALRHLDSAYARLQTKRATGRPLLASYALSMAMEIGDANLSRMWSQRTGCVRHAAVFGPLAWSGLQDANRPLAIESAKAPFEPSQPGILPFSSRLDVQLTQATGCQIDLSESSKMVGLRAVIVDADVDRPQRLSIRLTSTSHAVVFAGGEPVLVRPFDEGSGASSHVGAVDVPSGRLRIAIHAAMRDDGDAVILSIVGDDGRAISTHPPTNGEVAPSKPTRSGPAEESYPIRTQSERVTTAAYELAMGRSRRAEQLLEPQMHSETVAPLLSLLYARTLDAGSALPEIRRIERERRYCARVQRDLPSSWEAAMCTAALAGQRRGQKEGQIEALAELRRLRSRGVPFHLLLDVFEAGLAANADLRDIAQAAFSRVKEQARGTTLVEDLDERVHDRRGPALADFVCKSQKLDRNTTACFFARAQIGDVSAALAELSRLRNLRDSPTAFRDLELSQAVARGDGPTALKLFDAMPAGQRLLSSLALAIDTRRDDVIARLLRNTVSASDAPDAALTLRRLLLPAAEESLDEQGANAVARDRAKPVMPEAATLIVDHVERYSLHRDGSLVYVLHDVRRVSGTADVEDGAEAMGALVEGRTVHRVLRRRIFKRDGRVLEPDQAANAAQGHADLSQLEQGDYVQQIVMGLALPSIQGQIVVDTPELMPSRASLARALIEVRYPKDLRLYRWAHPMLGKATERVDGADRVFSHRLEMKEPRRLEAGVPKMEQEVGVSFGTQTWANIGRAIGEAAYAMRARDQVIETFARQAAGDAKGPSKQLVRNVVQATGKAVRVASGTVLTDYGAIFSSGSQSVTARTILDLGQGSRTWLAHEVLRSLGVDAEIVVAEEEPFASDPNFPAHVGRFTHPLLVAHLPASAPGGGGDIWMDLDVQGPPLPAGLISPELRGRKAIRNSGQIVDVANIADESSRDDIELELVMDDKGDARGTLSMVLRGREAQMLADAFEQRVGADRKDLLRSAILAWASWANVDDVTLSSSEGSWQVALRAQLSIFGYAQPEGKTYILPGIPPLHRIQPSSSATIAATFAGQGERQNALAIETAFHYRLRRRLTLPQGWEIVGKPWELAVDDKRVRASRGAKHEGNVIEETFMLSIPTGTILQNDFGDFAAAARRVDDAFLAGTRVTRPADSKGANR